MRELTFIVTDLYLDRKSEPRADASAQRLSKLETLLSRGVSAEEGDWREWVCRRVLLPTRRPIPVAPIARFAAGHPPLAGQIWLAQCVRLEAGLDRVFMSAASPASFTPEEWREIERGFNQTFGATGQALLDGEGGQAYLTGRLATAIETVDPVRVRGGDIHSALPSGPDAVAVKRLMTEIQMWLHDHPVNMRREKRGIETVNALWIWGGGELPDGGATIALPALYGDDAFLNGVWRLKGGVNAPLPASLAALDLTAHEVAVIALDSTPTTGQTHAQAMAALESDWFAPAVAALRRGQLSRVQVHANDRLFALDRSGLWRLWRRPRPWIEALS